MSCPFHSSIRQTPCTPRPARPIPLNIPHPERLLSKLFFPAPVQLERPPLVPDPIADPVVCPNVDEGFDAVFEEGGDVVRGGVKRVEGGPEGEANGVGAGREGSGGEGGGDTEESTSRWEVEVG